MKHIAVFAGILLLLFTPSALPAGTSDYDIAYQYTVRFYPRWLSWMQFGGGGNRLGGPLGMGPAFRKIVAVNDDTIYCGARLDLSKGPMILTIPAYPNIYSIAQLDVFGNIFHTSLAPSSSGGVYALVGPKWSGPLPAKVTKISFPYNSSIMFIRADKHSPKGVDQTRQATRFRANLQLQSLAEWRSNPTGGKASIVPLYFFNQPIKRMADEGVEFATESFLETLQTAMASKTTEPLTRSDKNLIAVFNERFNAAKKSVNGNGLALVYITEGARAAHAALIDRWLSNVDENNWIHFSNIGHWGTHYLDRAALTEYIQYGNESQTAYYAQAFMDSDCVPLDGSVYSYRIHFDKDAIPEATRFWSITAYTPVDVELVKNPLDKYVVASYTPGLVKDSAGGITIYIQAKIPKKSPIANWLPVPYGPFNVMLRIYGPEGAALDGTYVPPKITRMPYGFQ